MTMGARDTVVFDLGGVLIDWDPRHLYRKLFAGDEAAMERFLATVCTHEWNRGQDAGQTFAEGAGLLKAEHPDKAELIDAYCTRFDEMMPGPIAGSVEISPSSKPGKVSIWPYEFLGRDLPANFRALRVSALVSRHSGLG